MLNVHRSCPLTRSGDLVIAASYAFSIPSIERGISVSVFQISDFSFLIMLQRGHAHLSAEIR